MKNKDKMGVKNISIFTDGSSRGNPGPGGFAAIILSGDLHSGRAQEIGGREKQTTNNRMEMTAALEALSFLSKNFAGAGEISVTIFTDSSYLLNGITKWVSGWKRNDWITSTKQEVLNRDIWEALSDTVESLSENGFDIKWQIVKGHSGLPLNERCDEIATGFADELPPVLFNGPQNKYPYINEDGTIEVKSSDGASKSKSKSKSAKAYSYISAVDGVVMTHKTWKECEDRVKGISGARFKKSVNKSDEMNIIEDFS